MAENERRVSNVEMNTPLLGIIDDTDSPEAKMVVVVYGSHHRISVEYVSVDRRSLHPRRQPGCWPRYFTALDTFGVEARFTTEGSLAVRQTRASVAQYPDGIPRRWQGAGKRDVIEVRPSIAKHVIAALSARANSDNGLMQDKPADAGEATPNKSTSVMKE